MNLKTYRKQHAPKPRNKQIEGVIVLPFPPTLNKMYPTNSQGRRYLSKKGKAFKAEAKVILWMSEVSMLEGELTVSIKLYRPRKSGDIDNFVKPIFDAMQGICFENDSQITEMHVYRYDDKNDPRAEVEIQIKGE